MFKLIVTVRGGSTNHPLISKRFTTLDEARAGAKQLVHESGRVTRVMIVDDDAQSRFVEWIDRG